MNICAATTWYPRGELPRFTRLLPRLEEKYERIVIALMPSDDRSAMEEFTTGRYASHPRVSCHIQENRNAGRYMALKSAAASGADFVHYIDMDRLLHWVETQPDEWAQRVDEIGQHDFIIFGRTKRAMQTHPRALVSTEIASSRVVSHFLGQEADVSAGSKSFSRRAAELIIAHSQGENSIGSDAEWPILVHRAGFKLKYVEVEGLEWESADQFKPQAAQGDELENAAREYDANPQHWEHRVMIANEIIQNAFQASQVKVPRINPDAHEPIEFDFEAVFEVDDYMYFYSVDLTDERTDREVSALVSLLKLDKPMKILDLACGFGRHTNRLAALGHEISGTDISPGFLEIARQDALQRGVNVDYRQGDMRSLDIHSKFDIVLLLFTAFGYFSDEENLQVLVNVRNALVPGGRLVFDTPNRDTFLKNLPACYVVEKDGNMMIDRMSLDSLRGRSINRRVVFRDGIRKDKPSSVRIYNPSEIRALVRQAGMEVSSLYGGWDAQDVTQDARRLVVIAQKPY